MKFEGERIIPELEECGKNTMIFKEHMSRYRFANRYVKNKKVLDIACGVGYGSYFMAKNGNPLNVTGVDNSTEAIEYARNNYNVKNLDFQIMDAVKLDFPDQFFDCVVSFETIEHLPNYKKVINEFHRVLSDNEGFLIISTPNKTVSTIENPFHTQEFDKQELDKLLGNYFDSFEWYGQKIGEMFSPLESKLHIRKYVKIYRNMVDYFKPISLTDENEKMIQNIIVVCKKRCSVD